MNITVDNLNSLIRKIYFFLEEEEVSIKNETCTNITIEVYGSEKILTKIHSLYTLIQNIYSKEVTIIKNTNNDTITIDDINDNMKDSYYNFKWKITFNKLNFFKYLDYTIIPFFSIDNFNKFLKDLDIFNKNNEFIKYSKLQFILPKYKNILIEGNNFLISNEIIYNYKFNNIKNLPDDSKIKQLIQVLSSDMLFFSPQSFSFKKTPFEEPFIKILKYNYMKSLLPTIVNIFYNDNEIKIQGIKHIKLSLVSKENNFEFNNLEKLEMLVSWLYMNDSSTKLQLLSDRLSIYLINEDNLQDLLNNYIEDIYEEVIERYKFVIQEKALNYSKDLKDILKDTEAKTDKFSQKTREIINILLRDILGSIFFLGLTMYSRFSTNKDFILSNDANLIFILLSGYFLLSMISQSLFNFSDIKLTMNEVKLGSKSSQEYINKETYNKYVLIPLNQRYNQFKVVQSIIIFIYILLFIITINIQNFYCYFSN